MVRRLVMDVTLMTRDDSFEPSLGRIRSAPPKERRVLGEVLKETARAGGLTRGRRTSFTGARIGRGSGVGRVLASRDTYAAFRTRRVIVKTRIVKLQSGLNSAKVHLRYLQRDGVTREGLPGELYDAERDRADGKAFLERTDGDRHQFRFIVSPEDGAEYDNLKGFTRRLMRQMESDLGTKLDWVAVDHHNTGHPHSHILLRGKDEMGKDLVIARDYIAHGMRERAADIVMLDLGPRTDLDIENRLRAEIEQERFTSLDRTLQREAGTEGIVRSGMERGDVFRQSLRAGRLKKLRRLGLAEEIAPGQWRLADELEPTLRRMGERGDIIKALHAEMQRQGGPRHVSDYVIYDPSDPDEGRVTGRVVARGLSDEMNDRHYLIIDSVDGRSHYADIGRADAMEPTPESSIVAIAPKRAEARPVDHTVAKIAAAHRGRYSVDIHLRHDPASTQAFAETHIRRLEAMRRQGRFVEREPDGAWIIAPDHLERAASFERRQARTHPVSIETLSTLPLERQIGTDGATWLDRELVAKEPTTLRDAGFGKEAKDALIRRQRWLVEQELAEQRQGQIIYRASLLTLLRQRELTRVAAQLSRDMGLAYADSTSSGRIEGMYRRRLDLASGRFAIIEKSREFTLVPWRPVLERRLGKPVIGIVRGDTISWSIGRQRGPSVS